MPTLDQLYETKLDLQRSIRALEKRGALRTLQEQQRLKSERAALRRVKGEISKQVTQLRLF